MKYVDLYFMFGKYDMGDHDRQDIEWLPSGLCFTVMYEAGDHSGLAAETESLGVTKCDGHLVKNVEVPQYGH